MEYFGMLMTYMLPCLIIGMMTAYVLKEALDKRRRRRRRAASRAAYSAAQESTTERVASKKLFIYTFDDEGKRCA